MALRRFVCNVSGIMTLLMAGVVLPVGKLSAQGLAQGYFSDDTNLRPGMVVQLSTTTTTEKPKVESATAAEPAKIIGLATSPSDNFVVIGNGEKQVYVQTSGEARAYISNIGGGVKKGDLLTISPLKGILMKAVDNQSSIIFGTALEDFPTSEAQSYAIDGGNTDTTESLVAKISINLDSRSFASPDTISNSALARIGRSIVGREVGEIRVMIALIIFLIVLIAEAGIIYGAVSSAMTALGRNPMASKLIKKELFRVFVIATFVLSVGLGTIYGVLWL